MAAHRRAAPRSPVFLRKHTTAAARPAASPPAAPLTAEEARRQAEAEGLALLRCESNASGFKQVFSSSSKAKPYVAKVRRGGAQVNLGTFATAEEAALAFARSPEGRTAAAAAAAPPPEPHMTAVEARQQAEAEGLTLLRSKSSKTGFQNVYTNGSKARPYQTQVRREGQTVHLGVFATAEEAALAFACSPEGRAAAAAAVAPPPAPEPYMTAEEARRQAEAEGLTLLRSEGSASGFQGVYTSSGKTKPYQAQVWRGGTTVTLSTFATAEEAALAFARSPEGRAAAAAAAAPPPAPHMTAAEARRQANAEGLALLRSESNATGFQGVFKNNRSKAKPYQVQVRRGGEKVSLGTFFTAEEAALALARSPEGRAAAAAAAAPPPVPQAGAEAEPDDATIKEEEAPPAWPDGAVVKTEVVKEEAWPAKEEGEVQDEEEESPGVGVKRRRLG